MGFAAVAAAALAVGVASGAGSDRVSGAQEAGSIPAGFDLFQTDPEATVFRFRDQTAIPAGFFAAGSQGFEGDVHFGGVPLKSFRGNGDVGDADTVVQRKSAVTPPSDGSNSAPIDIQLVRLSLVSIAPIKVKVGSQTQLWEVRAGVSASRPSVGRMTVARTDAKFGRFDSRLVVYPKFTFTRVNKYGLRPGQASKVIDVGALPDGARPDDASLTFAADAVPWRQGCVEPALEIPGLNDGFCPGLKPGGNPQNPPFPGGPTDSDKKLTEHQSTYAQHGIWPVQARLEHFACYSVVSQPSDFVLPVSARSLKDQFGSLSTKVLGGAQFCNPARKNNESLKNTDAHLRCYRVKGQQGGRDALLRNQFGTFRLRVGRATRLCLPSTKQVVGGDPPSTEIFVTDHFQCYRVNPLGNYRKRTVRFRDQFQDFRVEVFKPSRLCAPVAKNKVQVQHAVGHLVCYPVDGPAVSKQIIVRNQFTQGRLDSESHPEKLVTKAVREVCIPSLKVALAP